MNVPNTERFASHEAADFSTLIAECCLKAQELEESGQYEAAREQLQDVWQRIGERPDLSQLSPLVAACVLLRAGTLSGWIGSAHQIVGAQEDAKDLITESIEIFEKLSESERANDARIDLAICYWREGANEEARMMLRDTIERAVGQTKVVARALLNMSIVEIASERYSEAEAAATSAVYTLEKVDEMPLLAQALMTQGVVLARMRRYMQAKKSLWRALEVAERSGDTLSAGQAHLTLIEELREQLPLSELAQHYEAANRLIGDNPDAKTAARLRACARHCAESLLALDDRQGIDAFLIGDTLEQEVLRLEGELIRRALDRADGHITIAARILGISHQALAYMLSARHPTLLEARTPITPRRRSIIKKDAQKPRRSRKS